VARDQSDLYWNIGEIASKEGRREFSAPANRKLRIEIGGWYDRPLSAAYTATYEPPITRDFLVKP
jgi:hypothetical protein